MKAPILTATCRRQVLAAAALALIAVVQTVQAQATGPYPNRVIRLVVGFPPGGSSDAIARVMGAALSAKLGQTVIVDNRPGANTVIAAQYVKSQPADGYTLLAAQSSFAINPSLQKLNYNIATDFAPVALRGVIPLVMVTPNQVLGFCAEPSVHVCVATNSPSSRTMTDTTVNSPNLALTDTQRQVLNAAADHAQGEALTFPAHVKGGARAKLLEGLRKRGLIELAGDVAVITAAGYAAIDRERAVPVIGGSSSAADAELETLVRVAEASWAAGDTRATDEAAAGVGQLAPRELGDAASLSLERPTITRRAMRPDTKQALVVGLLRRPEGATVRQIMDATGWQSHTVRGALAGAFKKKLGLTIVSEKPAEGDRIYRIA